MSGKRIGYVRVSSEGQNVDRQLDGQTLDKVYTDTASGKDSSRPQLKAMLEYIRDGDTLVVHSLDRLARNLDDLRSLVKCLTDKGVRVEFVKECLIFNGEDSAMSKLLLSVMGAFAEFERSLIRERQLEGIAIAKKKGFYKGRKKSLTTDQVAEIRKRLQGGETYISLSKEYSVTRQTIYNQLKAQA